jgi:hypothetical protein
MVTHSAFQAAVADSLADCFLFIHAINLTSYERRRVMPVFARRDVASIAIPATSGGCGNQHTRPVVQGAPVEIWKLDCPACTPVLMKEIESATYEWRDKEGKLHRINNSTWGDTEFRIPQTPDEASVSADMEREANRFMASTMQGVAAHTMHQFQQQRAAEVEESIKADDFRRMQEEAAALKAQLAEMQAIINSQRTGGLGPAGKPPDGPQMAEEATVFTTVSPCPGCGQPVPRKSAKGRPPKCPDCKAAA